MKNLWSCVRGRAKCNEAGSGGTGHSGQVQGSKVLVILKSMQNAVVIIHPSCLSLQQDLCKARLFSLCVTLLDKRMTPDCSGKGTFFVIYSACSSTLLSEAERLNTYGIISLPTSAGNFWVWRLQRYHVGNGSKVLMKPYTQSRKKHTLVCN